MKDFFVFIESNNKQSINIYLTQSLYREYLSQSKDKMIFTKLLIGEVQNTQKESKQRKKNAEFVFCFSDKNLIDFLHTTDQTRLSISFF